MFSEGKRIMNSSTDSVLSFIDGRGRVLILEYFRLICMGNFGSALPNYSELLTAIPGIGFATTEDGVRLDDPTVDRGKVTKELRKEFEKLL